MNAHHRHPFSAIACRVVVALLGIAYASRVEAAAGDLDPSFGTGGLVVGSLSPAADGVNAIAIQPDGKIVVGGGAFGAPELMLARYTTSGVLDPTFGTGGVVRGDIAGETVTDLVIQSTGRIVAAVQSFYGIVVAGYTPDGVLDHDFGVFRSGRTYLDLDVGTAGRGGIVQQLGVSYYDGGIVLGGSFGYGAAFALERVYRDGYPDSAFGAFFGICVLPTGVDDELWDVAQLPDGKFIAVGGMFAGGDMEFALVRFDQNGCADPTFGSGGVVRTSILPGANERARAVVVQPDGKLVVLGDTGGSPSSFAVLRYEPDGTLDPTFGTAGATLVSVGTTDVARDLLSSASGGFLVGGDADGRFTLVRLDAAGSVDPMFGTNGVVRVEQLPFPPCCAELRAIAREPDGRIVAAGLAEGSTSESDVALARFFGSTCGNGVLEAGEQCDDGNVGRGDCCSPRCERDATGTPCDDDGLRCTRDFCDDVGTCMHPTDVRSGCRTSTVTAGARLALHDREDDARDELEWRLRHGTAVAPSDLGDPLGETGYVLCGFGPDATLLFELDAPPGGTCSGAPCWTPSGSGFRYRDPTGEPTGTARLVVIAGATGRSRAVTRGKGLSLSLPALPLALPVRVDLIGDTGLCFESVFSTAVRNDTRRFKARSDD